MTYWPNSLSDIHCPPFHCRGQSLCAQAEWSHKSVSIYNSRKAAIKHTQQQQPLQFLIQHLLLPLRSVDIINIFQFSFYVLYVLKLQFCKFCEKKFWIHNGLTIHLSPNTRGQTKLWLACSLTWCLPSLDWGCLQSQTTTTIVSNSQTSCEGESWVIAVLECHKNSTGWCAGPACTSSGKRPILPRLGSSKQW